MPDTVLIEVRGGEPNSSSKNKSMNNNYRNSRDILIDSKRVLRLSTDQIIRNVFVGGLPFEKLIMTVKPTTINFF